jgi:hypothetical protein
MFPSCYLHLDSEFTLLLAFCGNVTTKRGLSHNIPYFNYKESGPEHKFHK